MANKMNIAVFVGVLIVFGLLNTLQGINGLASADSTFKSELPVINDIEEVTSGDYFRSYEAFFADHFIFSDFWMTISAYIDTAKGFSYGKDMEIVSTKGINVAKKFNDKESVMDTEWGDILIVDGTAMEVHVHNEAAIKGYADAINQVADSVDAEVFAVQIPTQIEFEEQTIYKEVSNSQAYSIEFLNSCFNESVTPVNVYDTIEKHKNEYVYMRTDHHWTALGAYYAYTSIIETLGDSPLDLNVYQTEEMDGYLGTLYNLTLNEKLAENPDILTAYMPVVDTTYEVYDNVSWRDGNVISLEHFNNPPYCYGVYIEGDSPLSVIRTDIENQKSIAIVKDSYANALIPFLTSHYSEIHIIDPRMYEGNLPEYISENSIDQLLFFNYVLVNRYSGFDKLILSLLD